MGYSDQKYQTRSLVMVAQAVTFSTSTGAGTASNSLGLPAGSYFPPAVRRSKISAIRVIPTTIINASATAAVMSFTNGTNTFATVTLTTSTQGQVLSATMTDANSTFTAGAQPSANVIGTFTASGGNVGIYDIYFEDQELPA